MDNQQLTQGLKQAFETEGHRLVFWYDTEQSFTETLPALDLPGVTLLNMAQEPSLGVKLRLELEDTEGKYLLYFPYPEPPPQEDWLLDIKLYSRRFYADRVSMLFNELGLKRFALRDHLAKRSVFCGSQARIQSLKAFIQPEMDEEALDLAMMAVTLGADSADLPTLLFTLGHQAVQEKTGLEANPARLNDLHKYGLVPGFVTALQKEVGYPATDEELSGEAEFKLGQALIRLLVTGFCEGISDIPEWARSIAIPSVGARASARALLSRWRDSSRYYPAFDEISEWVADALKIEDRLRDLPIEVLVNVETFKAVETQLVTAIVKAIPQAARPDLALFAKMIQKRLNYHWASLEKSDDIRTIFRQLYSALLAAIDLFTLRQSHDEGFHFQSSAELYKAYEKELYRFDQAYREYGYSAWRLQTRLLKPLDEAVEACYADWYLGHLSRNWTDLVESEQLLSHWAIPQVSHQQDFYAKQVAPLRDHHRKKRVVVIISDAFRYEAAVSLTERINEKAYSKATLTSQLGVLPSYTTLGMAALLPHDTLEYKPDTDEVLVDGLSTQGSQARHKILSRRGAMAVTADEVRSWSRDEGREKLKDQELIYVYHNQVDARGDNSATEGETFVAVEDAISDLNKLARNFMLNFNTSTLLITADHGFLYQDSKPEAIDRTRLETKPAGAFKTKKRYLLGHQLPVDSSVWSGVTSVTAGTATETHFWIPKGTNRFHFVGGARFVHGGAMPQEIVVPVIQVQQLRGEKIAERKRRKVGVISTKSSLKMVNNIQKFDLMQTEAVSELLLPSTLKVGIFDGDRLVSSEEVVTFDSASDSIQDRVKSVRLSLSGQDYDSSKTYALILKDKELNTELERYPVVIDLAFTDDFF